uniref:PB1-like domain-containing protein n=1 Tax=Lactuca sativa TaxID=4236 RepID=A0A9R1XS13_LACSA|nr:hypothetical protein LSAT_V11C100013550 [Lactuca sativa]
MFIFVFAKGYGNYFMLNIHYSGIFTKSPGRKYIDHIVSYIDDVDIDLFLVHELDDMVRELAYKSEQTLYYHLCIPVFPLDYGLFPLGNDQDVLKLVSYVPKHKLVKVYIENGQTRVPTYFKSPSKFVIEELEPESVSPELNRKILVEEKKDHVVESLIETTLSTMLLTSHSYHVDCNFQDEEEPICEDVGGDQSVRLDEFEAFTEDYSYYVEFDAEYSIPNVEDTQVGLEILKGMLSDDSGDAFNSQSGYGSDYSGDDYDDSDYIVHKSNLQFDVDVDISEFHSVVDVDEHGILNKQTKTVGNDIVHEELEVIQSDDYQFVEFHEDERKRMHKEISCQLHAHMGDRLKTI